METHAELQHLQPYAGFLALCRSEHTRRGYTQALRMLKAHLGEISLVEVTPAHVLNFAGSLNQEGETPTGRPRPALAPWTQLHLLAAVRKFFRYLAVAGVRPDDPAACLSFLRIRRPIRNPRALPHMDRLALLNALRAGTRSDLAAAIAVRLGFECGLRVSEISGLRVADLDLEAGTLRVVGKGDKERRVPMTEILREWFRAWLDQGGIGIAAPLGFNGQERQPLQNPEGSPFVFPNQRRPLEASVGPQVIERWVQAMGVRAGVYGLTVHVLRHTCATQLAETGASVYEIRDFLGHSTIQQTETYVRLASNAVRTAHARGFSTADGSPSREIPAKSIQQVVA
jgi:site-specific recombinase XerD